jgi:hypothetical protein
MTMKTRLFAALLVLISLAVSAAVVDGRVCSGKPNFASGESKGYFLWRDQQGWHIRWATKGAKRVYSGAIGSDAAFAACEGTAQGHEDAVVLAEPHLIRFESRSSGGVKGIDFDLGPGATKLSFDLQMDGATVDPEWVHMGFRGARPPSVPFVVEPRTR